MQKGDGTDLGFLQASLAQAALVGRVRAEGKAPLAAVPWEGR